MSVGLNIKIMEAKMVHDDGLLVINLLEAAEATVHQVCLGYVGRELVEGHAVVPLHVGVKLLEGS